MSESNCVAACPGVASERARATSLRAAALGYAARGWPVFPVFGITAPVFGGPEVICGCSDGIAGCPSPGKHPATPRGFKNATITEAGVRGYWTTTPHNIGVDLGAAGLLVVDLDSRAAVERWDAGPFGSIRTARASTGKGAHVYFVQGHDDKLIGSVGQSKVSQVHGLAATEIKANDGYAILPPSRHASGRFYAWTNPTAVIAPLPDALREWVLAAGAPVGGNAGRKQQGARHGGIAWDPVRNPQAFVIASLDRLADSPDGSRNVAACRAARELGQVADENHFPRELLRRWFFAAARDRGLMDDESEKTWDTWCRNSGDDCALSEVAA